MDFGTILDIYIVKLLDVDFSYCWLKLKHLVSRYPSDLKKSTVVDESLSSNQTNVLFQRLQLYFKIVKLCCK